MSSGAMRTEIPISAIMQEVSAWADEIVEELAAEVLLETRANASFAFTDRSKNLRKSIKKRKSKYGDGLIVGAFAPHAHLIEYGHDVKVGKNGKVVGHVPASPFLAPAIEAVKNRLPEIVNDVIAGKSIVVKRR